MNRSLNNFRRFKLFAFLLLIGLLLHSCFITSLYPFYTKDLIHFEKQLIGQWSDSEGGLWKVMRYIDFNNGYFDLKKKDTVDMNEKKTEFYHLLKQFYMVEFESNNSTFSHQGIPLKDAVYFLAVPFKINHHLFLDLTPHHKGTATNSSNSPIVMTMPSNSSSHKIDTHSLAKVDMDSKNQITITWLTEEKINALLDAHKIKIKYEKTGVKGKTLLTTSSEELVEFIKKYMNSKNGDRWDSDENQKLKFQLKRR
ncbi:hypothetical protein [Aestuariivivens sediminis]|uniref:hypothetical protein n=1 Tax=Aestuariivivens sediminis TaxID=2913557 RepID=UPI001F580BED|nr:hypothetical protein [Aestuariivivens sediminis]